VRITAADDDADAEQVVRECRRLEMHVRAMHVL